MTKSKLAKKQTLAERAMLVDFTVSTFDGRKKDKGLTEEVITEKKAEQDTGTWWTRTIPASALRGINTQVNAARTANEQMTLPWLDSGFRILPATMFLNYTTKMREIEQEYKKAVASFLHEEYPEIIKRAKERLGDLFNTDYFPSAEMLENKFRWQIRIMPLPEAEDFRVDLGNEAVQQIQQEIEAEVSSVSEAAVRTIWQRLYKVVEHVAERLGDDKNIFRDSLFTNVQELCNLLPKLNIWDDPELTKMSKEIAQRIAKQSTTEIRSNKETRKEIANAATDILKRMAGYCS